MVKTEKDWIIHAVFSEEGYSFHTHGLDKKNHKEIEIALDIDPNSAANILHKIVDDIERGKVYKDKDTIRFKEEGPDAIFVETKGKLSEDILLRLVLPDKNNKMPWDEGCEEGFKDQYKEETECQ